MDLILLILSYSKFFIPLLILIIFYLNPLCYCIISYKSTDQNWTQHPSWQCIIHLPITLCCL